MRLETKEKKELLSRAIEQMKQGKSNNEISQSIGVTVKTVREWLKPYREDKKALQETQRLMIRRINKGLEDPKTPNIEIKNLLECLFKLKTLILPKI